MACLIRLQLDVELSLRRGRAVETLLETDKVVCKFAAIEGTSVDDLDLGAL